MSFKEKLNQYPQLKKFVHWMLIPSGGASPRFWVKLLVNPFINKRGKGSKIRWKARMDILPFNKFSIGNRSTIEDFCTINNGVGDVFIGNDTLIGIGNVIIGPVSIGNNVIFAQNIVASGLNHEYRGVKTPISQQKVTVAEIIIEDDCWIAANAVITAGVTIGKHSVVAAGAIVTKSIPSYSVAAGNPARVIKKYNFNSENWDSVKTNDLSSAHLKKIKLKAKSNTIKELTDLQKVAEKEMAVEKKLDELITILSQSNFDNKTIRHYQQRFNNAIEKGWNENEIVDAFKVIDQKDNASRAELLEDFSMLLSSNKIDSKISSKYLKGERVNKIVLVVIAIIIITLGFAMIIMPAPPYFEMFTIFYFTRDDGITLMDLISLAIVFSGIYLLIRALYKKPIRGEKHGQ